MKVRLQSLPYGLRLLLATLSLGIGTGLIGIACHYLLEGVQELAFGQASSDLLQQFQEAGGLRRFLVLCVTGCLATGFWYVLQRRYKILSIRQQIDLAGDREPAPLA
ncbi:MAG: voltage-gated chloride channel, partial [Streptococcus mitis]|nr:voltage-gated chloride channel [Streptococcus mitis]